MFVILAIFLIQNVSATTTNIQVNPTFSEGEKMQFIYTITSDKNEEITYIPIIECENAPMALLMEQKITLIAGKPFNSKYEDKIVTEDYEPQKCTASISINPPYEQEFKKNFFLTTKPSFNLDIKICKDPECKELGKIFVIGEPIFIKISSSDKSTGQNLQPILLINHQTPSRNVVYSNSFTQLSTSEIGTHSLTIQASLQGYKIMKKTIYFGVIQKHADIPFNPPINNQDNVPLTASAIKESQRRVFNSIWNFIERIFT